MHKRILRYEVIAFQVVYGAIWILFGAEFFLKRLLAPDAELSLITPAWGLLTLVEATGGAMLMVGGKWSRTGLKVLCAPLALLVFVLPSMSLTGLTGFYGLVTAHVVLTLVSFPVLRPVRWQTKSEERLDGIARADFES